MPNLKAISHFSLIGRIHIDDNEEITITITHYPKSEQFDFSLISQNNSIINRISNPASIIQNQKIISHKHGYFSTLPSNTQMTE